MAVRVQTITFNEVYYCIINYFIILCEICLVFVQATSKHTVHLIISVTREAVCLEN